MMLGFPGGSEVKNLPANAEDMSSVPWLGRSYGEGNDNPLQYWCLGNPRDTGAQPGMRRAENKSLQVNRMEEKGKKKSENKKYQKDTQ